MCVDNKKRRFVCVSTIKRGVLCVCVSTTKRGVLCVSTMKRGVLCVCVYVCVVVPSIPDTTAYTFRYVRAREPGLVSHTDWKIFFFPSSFLFFSFFFRFFVFFLKLRSVIRGHLTLPQRHQKPPHNFIPHVGVFRSIRSIIHSINHSINHSSCFVLSYPARALMRTYGVHTYVQGIYPRAVATSLSGLIGRRTGRPRRE